MDNLIDLKDIPRYRVPGGKAKEFAARKMEAALKAPRGKAVVVSDKEVNFETLKWRVSKLRTEFPKKFGLITMRVRKGTAYIFRSDYL